MTTPLAKISELLGIALRESVGTDAFWCRLKELGVSPVPGTDDYLLLRDSEGNQVAFHDIWPPLRTKEHLEAAVRPTRERINEWKIDEGGFEVARVGEDQRPLVQHLLRNIKERRQELEELLRQYSVNPEIDLFSREHWYYEDPIYRFYHRSKKVLSLQEDTLKIVEILKSLLPDRELHPLFLQIIQEGTQVPELTYKQPYEPQARVVLEAFWHARHMLEMCVKYSKLEYPPCQLPAGWGTLLHLYQLRYDVPEIREL